MYKLVTLSLLAASAQAFNPSASIARRAITSLSDSRIPIEGGQSALEKASSPLDAFLDDIKTRIRIAQESNSKGFGAKQVLSDVIAGEYDETATAEMIEDAIASAPCVMFTWESSPSCKKAVEAFKTINANVKIVRLDDPWSEGNPIRAALGRKVGRSSVPFVFIGGKYVGGFDGGTGDEAPGMVDLAFKGTLRDMLADAGAMI